MFVPVAATALRERIANLAYYRVAAVDSEGNESVDSSILEIPAPFIYSRPPETAMRGKEFRYRVQSVASAGTPACVIPCDTTFLLRDEIKYELIDAPSYLRLDPVTGLLSGKFDSNGNFKVTLAAVKKKARDVQQFTVKVSK